jgi:hypothetical protein
VHLPRPPAISQGLAAFLWALLLGVIELLLMLGIGVPLGTSLIVAVASGFVIFFVVLVFGQDRVRSGS